MSNNVKDEGVTDREGRGARDPQILAAAKQMEKDNINAKKMDGSAFKKKNIYSKDNLLPDDILSLISYK
jgi:hypothetical protein